MDAIFCRNVMIYFDREGRSRFVREANRLLLPGGYLFVGSSESLSGIGDGFHAVMPSVYRKGKP
jgi:chemotaxis protein methyltransferase CheR